MGSAPSRRYMRGKRPEKYFEEDLWPSMRTTMTVINVNKQEALVMFLVFVGVDRDNSGKISMKEFCSFIGRSPDKLMERIFDVIDDDQSGELTFREFVYGMWNFCTYSFNMMSRFAFEIIDPGRTGFTTRDELDALYRFFHNTEISNEKVMGFFHFDEEARISFDTFAHDLNKKKDLIRPALNLQKKLRSRMVGVLYWERLALWRRKRFSAYDSEERSCTEAIRDIYQLRERADEEEEQEQKHVEAEVQQKVQEEEEQRLSSAVQEEAEWRKQQRRRKRSERSDLEHVQTKMWRKLQELRREFEEDVFTYGDLERRRKRRLQLYNALDTAIASSEAAWRDKEKRALAVVEEHDVPASLKSQFESRQGKSELRDRITVVAAQTALNRTHEEDALKQRFLERIPAEYTGPIGLQARILGHYLITGEERMDAEREAKQQMMAELMEYHKNLKYEEFRKEEELRKQEYKDFEMLLAQKYGSRHTAWEVLYDYEREKKFYQNRKTKVISREALAICELCDAILEPMDPKCFNCHADRSTKNRALYRGMAPLDKDEDDVDDSSTVITAGQGDQPETADSAAQSTTAGVTPGGTPGGTPGSGTRPR